MNGLITIAPPGTGKSFASHSATLQFLQKQTQLTGVPCVAIMASHTRKQAQEWAAQARDQGLKDVYEVYGRNASNCFDDIRCAEVGALGYEPMAVLCPLCKHHPDRAKNKFPPCRYITDLDAAAQATVCRLIFCCYEAMPTIIEQVRSHGSHVTTIVFDEDPSRYFLQHHKVELRTFYPKYDLTGISHGNWMVLYDKGQALFSLLREFEVEMRSAGDAARATCGTLYRRLEELVAEKDPQLKLADLLAPDVEAALIELVKVTRKSAISGGIHRLKGGAVRPWLPTLIGVMREEYALYCGGTQRWNPRIVVGKDGDKVILTLAMTRPLPSVDNIVVLDATANVERLQRLMPEVTWKCFDPKANLPEFNTVHVRCSTTRRVIAGPKKEKLLAHVATGVERYARDKEKILVVSYGNQKDQEWQKALASTIKGVLPSATVVDAHFGELRGSNKFKDFDVVITVGDNEPPPFGLLDEISPLYADDPEPLSMVQENYAGHRRYKDARVRAWAERHTIEELTQVAHRHRPCTNPGRTYIHFGLMFPAKFLGRPTVSIVPRQFEANMALGYMRDFLDRHGWLCTPLLVAVGYVSDKKCTADSAGLETLREAFGSEFPPLKKPYSERQLRNIQEELLESQPRFIVRCQPDFGIGERIGGWGERDKFEAEWELLIKNSDLLRLMQLVHKVRSRKEMVAFTQKSA